VGDFEVQAAAVAVIRKRLVDTITPAKVKHAQVLQAASVNGIAASAGNEANKLFSEALDNLMLNTAQLIERALSGNPGVTFLEPTTHHSVQNQRHETNGRMGDPF